MEETFQAMRMRFLTAPCGGTHQQDKNPCGAGKDGHCFELGAKVYGKLGEATSDNEVLAISIAKELRLAYPHFQWSVIVFRQDPRHVEFHFNTEHCQKMRFQRFGSEVKLTNSYPENFVVSSGLGKQVLPLDPSR